MKALVRQSYKSGDLVLKDMPEPSPGEGQAKVKVEYAGICGSDTKSWHRDMEPGLKLRVPRITGHEGVGIVVELGSGVTNVAVGDRVAAETTVTSCGECRFCRVGRPGMCANRQGLGTGADGYFAEYVIAAANGCHKIPEHVDPKGAAVLEPLGCAVKGVIQHSRELPGDVAVVFGPGAIGQCTAQVAKAAGAHVIMVGTPHSRSRLEVARRLCADQIMVSGEQDVASEVMALTDGQGADIVYEAVGSQAAFGEALRCVRKLGQFVVLASAGVEIPFNVRWFFARQITMIAAVSCDPLSWDYATNLLNRGLVNLSALVTDVFPLEEWFTAFTKAEGHEGIKILLKP